jgi:hypothetical protein
LILGNVGLKMVFRLGRDDAQTMSADLTGDRKAIDFTRLPVGTCIIKRGNEPLVGVEINTPIGNGGVLDAGGREFLKQVHGAHPNKPYVPPSAARQAQPADAPPRQASRSQRPKPPSPTLEDFL